METGREGEKERSFIHWFITQTAATSWFKPGARTLGVPHWKIASGNQTEASSNNGISKSQKVARPTVPQYGPLCISPLLIPWHAGASLWAGSCLHYLPGAPLPSRPRLFLPLHSPICATPLTLVTLPTLDTRSVSPTLLQVL